MSKIAFVFICQKGELEIKSLLLALSLKQNIRGRSEIIAAIPASNQEQLSPSHSTLELLQKLNVRIEHFENTLTANSPNEKHGNLIANKIFCLNIPTDADTLIFLDSDMLCLQEINTNEHFKDITFGARLTAFSKIKDWDNIYNHFQLEVPKHDYQTLLDKKETPIYFNSGCLVLSKEIIPDFHTGWLDNYKMLSSVNLPSDALKFRDQISLTLTVQKMNLPYDILDKKFNFPARDVYITQSRRPFFAHYHDPLTISKNPILRKAVQSLIKTNPELKELINSHPNWQSALNTKFHFFKTLKHYFRSKIHYPTLS